MMDTLRHIGAHLLYILKIYLQFAIITLVVYFSFEWYISEYAADFEAQWAADAKAAEEASSQSPTTNSTLGKAYRMLLRFLVLV